jgi:sRNA-binding protein
VRVGKDQQAKHALCVEREAKAVVNSDRQARAAVRVALARSAGDSPCATRKNNQETPERGKHWGGDRRGGQSQDEA